MTTRRPAWPSQPGQPKKSAGDVLPGGGPPPKKSWQKWAWIGGGLFALVALAGLCASPETERAANDQSTPSPSITTEPSSPGPTTVGAPPRPPDAVAVLAAQVTRVIDGDTAEMMVNGQRESVRFIGMDAPEPGRPYSAEATTYVRERIEGKRVFLEKDVSERDSFGRLLRYVWYVDPTRGDEAEVREHQLNGRMVLDGFANVATFPPDVKYIPLFSRFQEEARSATRGLWAAPVTTTPTARASTPVATTTPAQKGNCDPSYPTVCIPPPPPDLDCPQIQYRDFPVQGADPHRFDGSPKNGIGCES